MKKVLKVLAGLVGAVLIFVVAVFSTFLVHELLKQKPAKPLFDGRELTVLPSDRGETAYTEPAPQRVDLVVVPRQDIFPRLPYDSESDPKIDRKLIKDAHEDIQIPPNPFQPGTRPSNENEGLK